MIDQYFNGMNSLWMKLLERAMIKLMKPRVKESDNKIHRTGPFHPDALDLRFLPSDWNV